MKRLIISLKLINYIEGLKVGIGPFYKIELRDIRPNSRVISVRAFNRNTGKNTREEY
jgi:hypothetical protein